MGLYDENEVMVDIVLDSEGGSTSFRRPQSYVETILLMHNYMAQYGMPKIEIRTLTDKDFSRE